MRVIYLALIALGIVMAVVYLGHAIAWPSLSIPNPLNEKLSVNTQGVVQLYITALELNALGNYTGALSITKVLGITAAVKVSPLISQLHNYEVQLTNYLVELRSIYNEMVNSISLGNYTGARSLAIEGLLIDSEADNELNAILSMFNNIAPGSAGQVISAAQSIRQYLIGLNETFINVLTSNYTRTELTVNATPSTVVVGSQVTVYGVLTTINGTPIPNATINIYVGGNYVGKALTNVYGQYLLTFTMPQVYVSNINLTAIYNPPLGSNYLPSEATVQVNVAFNTTSLTANYTSHVMWGEPINVSGYVSGPPIRQVIISIDGVNVSTYTVNNEFSVMISTGNMTPGNYSITIYAPPVGPYSPAYVVGSVSVNSVVTNITISTNYLAIAGLPITLRGFVSPWVGNLSLSLSIGGETMHLDLNSPNFTVSMPTSLLLSMGRHDIVISVSPNPPVMGIAYTYGIFVVNIPEVIIPMAIIVALFLIVRSGAIALPGGEGITINNSRFQASPILIMTRRSAEVRALRKEIMRTALRSKIDIKSVRDIVDALASAIYAIGNRTGVRLRSTDTLREYLRAVQNKLSEEEYAVFAELVRLGEYALYSPHIPSDEDVRRAWELAGRLTR